MMMTMMKVQAGRCLKICYLSQERRHKCCRSCENTRETTAYMMEEIHQTSGNSSSGSSR
jgi:hypothetical protein